MNDPRASLPPADDALWSLVEALVEGRATSEERDRLEARLRAEPAARVFYVAFLDLHAHLQWRTRGQSVPSVEKPRQRRRRVPFFGSPSRAVFAAALVLLMGLFSVWMLWRHGPEEGEPPDLPDAPPGSVAVLIDNRNTVWEEDTQRPTGTGSPLPPGRLKLRAGVVEIAFHGGGEVLLEGPADLDVSGADGAFLHHGKLTAKVPEGAPAFRVNMPGVAVTQLGGECGLRSDESGLAEVHVFTGQATAKPTDPRGEPLPGGRLIEKAGVRVDTARHTMTEVPLNEQSFAHLRPEVRISDVTVRGGQFADRNFGIASRLVVKNSIPDYSWDSYLRFDLSGVKDRVASATVRLVPVRVGHPLENAAALVPDHRWSETALTWNTRPPSGPEFARWTVEEGKPVEFDVTPLVQAALSGDRLLSLRIYAPERKRGSHYVEYGSRRSEAASRPQLLITTVP